MVIIKIFKSKGEKIKLILLFPLIFTLFFLVTCKSDIISPDTNSEIPEFLTEEEFNELNSFPLNTTLKFSDILFNDGSSEYDFLLQYDPNFLNKYPSGKVNKTLSLTLEEKRKLLIARMSDFGCWLTKRLPDEVHHFHAEGPNKPEQNGFAYVYGGKDFRSRIKPKLDCSTEELYGFDCSGMIYQMSHEAGLNIIANPNNCSAKYLSDIENWMNAFNYSTEFNGLKAINVGTKVPVQQIQSGDIIIWFRNDTIKHIGFSITNGNSGNLMILNSHGTYKTCKQNKDTAHGPVIREFYQMPATKCYSDYKVIRFTYTGSWAPLGTGMSGGVYYTGVNALSIYNNELIAGGFFTTAGGVNANNIAKWNGSNWAPLGSGLNGTVRALTVYGNDLILGGDFYIAGGINAIAKWNGNSWSPLGSGIDNIVYALTVYGDDLIAGGFFVTAGGKNAFGIAKWNGNSWDTLGSGLGQVQSLTVYGNELIAGGYFTSAGNYIAKWNGNSWSSLGSGIGNIGSTTHVDALSVYGSDLVVGGSFSIAGGVNVNNIAKWNGNSWAPFSTGLGGQVNTLTVYGSDLIVGGSFTYAGNVCVNHITKWNGYSWSSLVGGMNNDVYSLAVYGGNLIAGGGFTSAGGISTNYIAKWIGFFLNRY